MIALKQILKWTIICLLSFTTFNFFISGKIEASIEIEAPADVVYEKVTNLQTWPTWAARWKKDSTMTTVYSGEKSGLGAKMSWTGIVGGGSLEIIEANFAKNLKNKLIVEGVNIIKKHAKPTQSNPDGGILEYEAPFQASNVMIVEKKTGVTRIGYKTITETVKKIEVTRKVRYSKKSGEVLD